jgi:hypothetical protein
MNPRIRKNLLIMAVWLVVLLMTANTAPAFALEFPGPDPEKAEGKIDNDTIILKNKAIECIWSISDSALKPVTIKDYLSNVTLQLKDSGFFVIAFADNNALQISSLSIMDKPRINKIAPKPKSARLAERSGGKEAICHLNDPEGSLEVEWHAELRDGSNYVRQKMTITAKKELPAIKYIVAVDLSAKKPKVIGTVDGSPIATENFFFACEHPLSKSSVRIGPQDEYLCCDMPVNAQLKVGESKSVNLVVGVVPKGQLRRGFLYYIERERAHPYRPFLHYNSWFDIAWHDRKMTEKECLECIRSFGEELIKKRGVKVDSFCFDDGWDDNSTLWQFNKGFPNGFSEMRKVAEKYGSALGTWMSPWGGYSTAGNERLKYGAEQGFEMYEGRFALSGPKYYTRFRDVCMKMIKEYGVNYFKFDGVGASGGGNVDALLRLTQELRVVNPDLFLNITIGTWQSPYWLWYGDTTWRSGGDTGMSGKGSKRQQWITYRDKETYASAVTQAPLYPLNSIMLHGMVFALKGEAEAIEWNHADFIDEIHDYFGTGTHLQEMYITASKMTPETWDALAEGAKWSKANADILVDTHWIGGNPDKGEVYGWASWAKRKGILVLRNPDDAPAKFTLDVGRAFELPDGAPQKYSLKSPWKTDAAKPPIDVAAGKEHVFELKPFEILVFDAMPVK